MPQYNVSYRCPKSKKLTKLSVFSISVADAERDASGRLPAGVVIEGVERVDGDATRIVQSF